ncbi:MAG: bifunctional UDP-N-acetylglucosamine diphosphorylase/glucosamine-1-phosphate N-acetyltransferase GlmU [Clostridiales bacterium]|nr:bifunctional UDP-N-acetylglucosamine diphosphorylase/glucosamine-1-phosphate N-acetyltransferase GlmU [Clostridiales bacterium]
MNKNLKVIILAAGQGTRMKSKVPKVLHKVLDKTMLDYVIDASLKAGASDICVVVGHKSMLVRKMTGDRVKYALQKEQLGTGHAVMQAEDFIGNEGSVLVLCGDTPLIRPETIEKILSFHSVSKNAATGVSFIKEEPTGYGRIIRDDKGGFVKIIEQKDGTPSELAVKEVNSGVYIFEAAVLKEALSKLSTGNAQGEYYLTDTMELIKNSGKAVGVMTAEDEAEFLGVNSKLDLSVVTKALVKRINEEHMLNGVTITNPENTYIGQNVEIEPDTIILPGTTLEGRTKIGTDCVIGPNTQIISSEIKDGVNIKMSVIMNAYVDNYTTVGPFAYLRPGSNIGEHVRIGDFVEIKNSNIDDGTKVSHLTYVGDSDVGKNVNFGCGTVTANYDGVHKYRTTINDNAFIGCNTNLIAPITVGENAVTAAGSTINKDVPPHALSIARKRQVNLDGWADKAGKK